LKLFNHLAAIRNMGRKLVVVLFLREAQKQHNNKFSLFSQKALTNFESLIILTEK